MNENKGIMSTKIELTLEQSQQGVSNDVLVQTTVLQPHSSRIKTSANFDKQDLPLRYQVYQGRLLAEHGSLESIRNQASGEIVSLRISSQTRKLVSSEGDIGLFTEYVQVQPDGNCGAQNTLCGVLKELMHYFDQAFNSFDFEEKCGAQRGSEDYDQTEDYEDLVEARGDV
ncbi:hypothetical protein Tco_1301204 [Tanacetum coccineum]